MSSTLLRYALFFVFMTAPLSSYGNTWGKESFTVSIGTQERAEHGLLVRSNPQGQVLIGLPAGGMSLDKNFRVTLHYSGTRPSAIYVIWRNSSDSQLHQRGVAPGSPTETVFDMRGITGWSGEARTLEIGLQLPPGEIMTVSKITLDRPGLADKLGAAWSSWTAAEEWRGHSINVHTGTRNFRGDPYPVAVITILGLIVILSYLLMMRRRSRYRHIAAIFFGLWLAVDGLWQWDLWRQINATLDRYWGLTPREKLMASEDALFASLGEQVRKNIPEQDARVFIASSSDPWSMLSAYYVSPLNTFWHRHGPELPDAKYLRRGDYILLLAASSLRYKRGEGYLQLGENLEIPVEERLADRAGYLLEVQ